MQSTGNTINWSCSGSLTQTSDKRLKKDINPITDALSKVQAMNGVNFTYINDGEANRTTGLIAQDVQAVLPEAVFEGQDGYLALGYGNMVGLLVESIKELTSRVKELESK